MSSSECTDSEVSVIDPITWIQWFINLRENRWMVEIDCAYIEDVFNLYGLRSMRGFAEAVPMMLESVSRDLDKWACEHYAEARDIYILIHARFILTTAGMSKMEKLIEARSYGQCMRYYCNSSLLLPMGLKEELGSETVLTYCPRCEDIYRPAPTTHRFRAGEEEGEESSGEDEGSDPDEARPEHVDGAAFGPTFAHLFLMVRAAKGASFARPMPTKDIPSSQPYVPRVFGFKVHNQRGRVSALLGDAGGVYFAQIAAPRIGAPVAGTDPSLPSSASSAPGGASSAAPAPLPVNGHSLSSSSFRGLSALIPAGAVANGDVEASFDELVKGAPPVLAPYVHSPDTVPGGIPVYFKLERWPPRARRGGRGASSRGSSDRGRRGAGPRASSGAALGAEKGDAGRGDAAADGAGRDGGAGAGASPVSAAAVPLEAGQAAALSQDQWLDFRRGRPITTSYAGGVKPFDDDFDDDSNEEVSHRMLGKRKR